MARRPAVSNGQHRLPVHPANLGCRSDGFALGFLNGTICTGLVSGTSGTGEVEASGCLVCRSRQEARMQDRSHQMIDGKPEGLDWLLGSEEAQSNRVGRDARKHPILVNIAPPLDLSNRVVALRLDHDKVRVVQRQPGGQLGKLCGGSTAVPVWIVERAARARVVEDVFGVLRRCADEESA